MVEVIHIPGGVLTFEPMSLYHGRGAIDLEVSRQNVLAVEELLRPSGISWGLMFGSLLGAVRDGDLIAHDEDVDVFVMNRDRTEFLALLPKFVRMGFSIARSETDLLSLFRKGDYVDFYFMRARGTHVRVGTYRFPASFFRRPDSLLFLGRQFPTPRAPEHFLKLVYGPTWKTPIVGAHAVPIPKWWRHCLPDFILKFSRS